MGATPDGKLEEPDRQGHGRGADAGNGHHRHQGEVDQTVTLATGHFSCSWNDAAADKLRLASRVLNETPRAALKKPPGVFFLHQKLCRTRRGRQFRHTVHRRMKSSYRSLSFRLKSGCPLSYRMTPAMRLRESGGIRCSGRGMPRTVSSPAASMQSFHRWRWQCS